MIVSETVEILLGLLVGAAVLAVVIGLWFL